MFKKTKAKIVAAILLIMVLLLAGTLCVIYISSYRDVYQSNQEMLERYIDAYLKNGNPEEMSDGELPDGEMSDGELSDGERPDGELPDSVPEERLDSERRFQLSTFYAVELLDGEAVSIDHSSEAVYTDAQLEALAREIIGRKKDQGIYGNLVYRVSEETDGTLVVMMDNTIMKESITTLFQYTLLFGCVAILVIFFLALFLAGRILKPLEENDQKQKQFISDAGHELKTPLSAVSANVELLTREIGENQWLSNIQYENDRMTAVIRQMLTLARAENREPVMAQVDFSRIVMGELLSFEAVAFEKGITLSYDTATEEIPLLGDGEQLRQLVAILLDNALSHSPADGTVTAALSVSHKRVSFSVSNEGEPIPEDKRELIFERFYRLDASRSEGENHYGLGLAIAKAITASHHGTLLVDCRDGKVSFTASFPVKK